MADYVERLEQLQEFIDAQEYDKIIFDCQSLLGNQYSHDMPDTLRRILLEVLAKSHVQLEQWQEVLALQDDSLKPLHAYAQYRLGNYAMAKELLSVAAGDGAAAATYDRLSRHTLAQSLYRLHDTTEAINRYEELLSSMVDEDDNDGNETMMQTLTNAFAVRIANAPVIRGMDHGGHNGAEDRLVPLAESFLETMDDLYYDLAYNLGTYQVLHGDTTEGLANLHLAERTITDQLALAGGVSTHDDAILQKDLLPIRINIQWTMQRQGESVPNYNNSSLGDDFVTKMNAGKTLTLKELPAHATPFQKRCFYYNQAILALQTRQYPLIKLYCTMLLKSVAGTVNNASFPDDTEWWKSRVVVLEALSMAQQGKVKDAIKQLQQQLPQFESDVATAWVQLQLAKLEGKLDSSMNRLEVLSNLPPSIAQSRAVLATRAAIHQDLGQEFPKDLLNDEDKADLLLLQEKYDQAAPYFANKTDVMSRVKYALCLSYSDPDKALQIWNDLDIQDGPTTELSGDTLEQMPLPRVKSAGRSKGSSLNSPLVAATSTATDGGSKRSRESVLRRRAKQREKHLAKLQERGIDITRPPNPDRWIPKYERSKNRRRGQHKGAQGGFTEKDAAKYDVAARKAEGYNSSAANKNSTAHMSVAGDGGGRRGGRRR